MTDMNCKHHVQVPML